MSKSGQIAYKTYENSSYPPVNTSGVKKKCQNKKCSNDPYNLRDQKVDSDLYYHVKSENEELKKTKLKLNDKIKQLECSLQTIKENLIKERRLEERPNKNTKEYNKELEMTKYENERLKNKEESYKLYIKALQSNTTMKPKNNTRCKSSKKFSQTTKNDNLALIARLREELKKANDDRRNLIDELKNANSKPQNFKTQQPIIYQSQNYDKELNNKYADLSSNYEKTNIKLDTQNKILELTKSNLKDYMEKYEKEREKCRKLETELSLMRAETEKNKDYKALIEDYKKRENELQEKINDLCNLPLIKETEERGNIYRKFQINEKKLIELEKQVRDDEYTIKNLEKENKQLKENLDMALIDKDKFKEQAMRLKLHNEEKEKSDKMFQDKLNLFSQYGEVDSNYLKMLELLKLQNPEINWADLDLLDPIPKDKQNDPIFLKNEIKRVKEERGKLAEQLEKTRSLLLIQQQIDDDVKKMREFDNKKYQAEIKYLKQKIEELCKLVDIQKLPKEYLVQDENGNVVLKERTKLINEIIPVEQKDVAVMDDTITEFSQDDTDVDFGVNENALDIYLGECIYEDGLENELGFAIENMMSFFTVDFFIHETQTSDILNGKNPMFNFQLTFKVNVDEHLLNYLESNYINIELYFLRDNVQSIFGKGKISLKELINIEKNIQNTSRVINSVCSIYFYKNEQLKIASIHYKMRMRKPISEALKWYHDQNQFIRETNPLHDAIMKNAEKTINTYSHVGGKIYEIKILINRAINLIITGQPRHISPYFYYRFYKTGEKYSAISSGNDPLFEDVTSFTEQYNIEFHDYIEKESLNVYIFDSANPIEVDVSNKNDVKLVNTNQQLSQDLIGVCRIPLKGLLINDLVQGDFPITNMKNQKVGSLLVNIFWEEVLSKADNNDNNLPYETKAFEDQLVIKLAQALKNKGLNVDSAFKIFDIDQKNEISLSNFKDTLLFTLKFISNQQELEHLINILYMQQNRTILNKMDFYKIFGLLLPSGGPMSNLMSQSYINNEIKNDTNINKTEIKPNLVESQQKINMTIPAALVNDRRSSYNINNRTQPQMDYSSSNINLNSSGTKQISNANNTNRELKVICDLINEYKFRTGKEAVDLYKLFDRDTSLKVDQKELYKGFQKMGINLSNIEMKKVWKELTKKDISECDSFDYNQFKAFHDKYCNTQRRGVAIPNDISTSQNVNNFPNLTQSQRSNMSMTRNNMGNPSMNVDNNIGNSQNMQQSVLQSSYHGFPPGGL